MKLRAIAAIALTMSLLLSSPAGQAQLIDQGGMMTLDPATNLLWLDTSSTVGISAQSILNGTDPGNLLAAGWSFASVSQISTLLTNAGLMPPLGTPLALNFAAASSFIALFGATGTGTGSVYIQAFSADQPSQGFLNMPIVLAGDFGTGNFVGQADLPGPPVLATTAASDIGSWLVMSNPVAPVPEPEIYAMMGVGLALLGWVGRRRKVQSP